MREETKKKVISTSDDKKKKDNTWKKKTHTILITEFLGTIFLVLWIVLPSSMGFSDPDSHTQNHEFWLGFSKIWDLFIMKTFWVAAGIIGIVYLTISISANFNPCVTLAEIIRKNDTPKLGAMKISVQMLGGLIAGFIAIDISKAMHLTKGGAAAIGTVGAVSGVDFDAISPRLLLNDFQALFSGDIHTHKVIGLNQMAVPGLFLILSIVMECLLTFGVLASVFYFDNKVKKSLKPLFIGVFIWALIIVGVRTDNIALNPARLFGASIAYDFANTYQITNVNGSLLVSGAYSRTIIAILYFVGELGAVALFWFIEDYRNKNSKAVPATH